MSEPIRSRRFRYSLRTLFVVVTLCALVSPFLPMTITWINAWLHPPKRSSTIFYMVTPSGGRLPPGRAPVEEEDTLIGAPRTDELE